MAKEKLVEKIIQLSDELAREVYPLTIRFPKIETYALADQLRRAIVSVPTNIIEGYRRGSSSKERRRFFEIAYGSLAEAKYLIYFAHKQNYIENAKYKEVAEKSEETSKLLWSLMEKIKEDIQS